MHTEEQYQQLLEERNQLAGEVKRLQEHIRKNDIGDSPITKEDILKVEDMTERQKLISENLHLF